MKYILGTIFLLAAVVAAWTSAAEVELSGRTLEGVVRDLETAQSIPFASVTLTRPGSRSPEYSAVTDAEGKFGFVGLARASYRVEVRYSGYQLVSEGLEIGAGEGPVSILITMLRDGQPETGRSAISLVSGQGSVSVLSADQIDDLTDYAVRAVEEAVRREREKDGAGDSPSLGSVPESRVGKNEPGRYQDFKSSLPSGRATLNRANAYSQAVDALDAETLLAQGADEIWIIERPAARRPVDPETDPGTGCLIVIDDDGTEIPVPLEHTEVRAQINGYTASVEVRQRFKNPFDETIEAEYIFPLPQDAAVNDFLMIVGERRIRGIIREKEEAREIYERARQAGYVASLLEQVRPNIFRQKVANIEPGNAIDVELHYFNALPYRDGEFEFAFPLVVGPRFNPPNSTDPIGAVSRGQTPAGNSISYLAPDERSGHDVNITVELDAGMRIEGMQSLNHAARIQREGKSRALIELSPYDRIPNKDFVLRYRVASDAVKSEILVHREAEDGYFSMMLVPPASLENLQRAPVEFVFVVDCSGSMGGWPMEKAKAAMSRALMQLREGDSFQVIRFSEQASALGSRPLEATEANVKRGLEYVDALQGGGGTMMVEGIKAALDFPHDDERMRIVSFMTDGYIGNEAEIFAAIAERLGPTRIFSFGVGNSVNRHLIEGMARMGKGAVAYIGLNDDLDAVDEFYNVVRHPALTDIEIEWGGMDVKQVFPQQIGDLFVGRPVLLHGRYDGRGNRTVTVRGRAAGRDVAFKIKIDLDATRKRESLPLLWARSEIQHIADRLAVEADSSLESRALDLALNFNLLSDWTSFVAVDASTIVDEPGTRTETVPVPVPDGVKYDTTVKGQGR